MKRISILLALTAAFLLPGQLQAQVVETGAVEAELRSMITEDARATADRDVILDFLNDDGVAEVATRNGLDIEAMKTEVQAMDGDASSDLAERVRDLQQEAQVGGDTIVITSTTVIIVLL
ncbi:MAG: hypothetical protein R3253_13380, partial [Longimicrobiales bacterium]|nr:hypothetical protein [Longimicrobiales bacterium]